MPIERFFESLGFEQRGKLDHLGVEIGSIDKKYYYFGSSPVSWYQDFFH